MPICTAPGCDKKASRRLGGPAPLCWSHYYRELQDRHPPCSMDGCGSPAKVVSVALCARHYHRLCRNGHPMATRRRESRGVCVMDGCENLDCGPHGLCPKHETRVRRYGDPHFVPKRRFKRGADSPGWRGDDIAYRTAHERLQKLKGPARQHNCIACSERAADWSYNYADPNEKTDPKTGALYSANPDFYEPRCRRCHTAFDQAHRTWPDTGGFTHAESTKTVRPQRM